MKPVAGDASVDFAAVVSAFESTYACLDINPADIGCYDGREDAGCAPGSGGSGSGSSATGLSLVTSAMVASFAFALAMMK